MDKHELSDILTEMISKHATAEEIMRMSQYSAASIELGKLRGELGIDQLLVTYGDSDGRRKAVYGKIVVVATSFKAGHEYAEALGLENYVVVTSREHAQGRRFKAYVVTPGYLEQIEDARWRAGEAWVAIQQGATLTNAPRG